MGEDHDRQDADDRDRDRRQEDEGSNPGECQDAHRLFGRVRGRGDVVGAKDRQSGEDGKALGLLRLHAEALTEKETPDQLVRPARAALRFEKLLVRDVAVSTPAKPRGAVELDITVSGESPGLGGAVFERRGLRCLVFSFVVGHVRVGIVARDRGPALPPIGRAARPRARMRPPAGLSRQDARVTSAPGW